jgi:hypothetical protein
MLRRIVDDLAEPLRERAGAPCGSELSVASRIESVFERLDLPVSHLLLIGVPVIEKERPADDGGARAAMAANGDGPGVSGVEQLTEFPCGVAGGEIAHSRTPLCARRCNRRRRAAALLIVKCADLADCATARDPHEPGIQAGRSGFVRILRIRQIGETHAGRAC